MSSLSAAPPSPLDAPLPTEISGSGHGWWNRYRRFPVFSAPWVRGRLVAWSIGLAIWALIVLSAMLGAQSRAATVLVGMIHIVLVFGLPIVVGPLLGLWVRRRRLPHRTEGGALVAAIVAVVIGSAALQWLTLEPIKQAIAERLGDVDSHGQRNRVRMVLGLSIENPPPRIENAASAAGAASAPASAAAAAASAQDTPLPQELATSAFITFWLAGGMALWTWRRQHLMLEVLRKQHQLEAARAAQHEAELRLSVLAAQVEPHFLFNTLAGVRGAMISDPRRASEMIDRLVDYLRASIPRLRADGSLAHSSLGTQLDIVRAYLGLMRTRMPRLDFSVDAPAALNSRRFPPLMLISLAENAVKHGIEPKIGPATITVTASAEGDRLLVSVADDGVGFGGAAAGSGIGLQNVRARLVELYGERAALELKAGANGGVIASIRLPLEES